MTRPRPTDTRANMGDGGVGSGVPPAWARATRTVVAFALVMALLAACSDLPFGRLTDEATERPYVTSSTPGDGAADVAWNATLEASVETPNGPLDPGTVDAESVRLTQASTDAIVAGNVSLAEDAKVRFTPVALLGADTAYELTLTDRIRDVEGASLRSTTIGFRTRADEEEDPSEETGDDTAGGDGSEEQPDPEPEPDPEPGEEPGGDDGSDEEPSDPRPEVVGSTPADGDAGVKLETAIHTRFDLLPLEEGVGSSGIERDTVHDGTVRLRRASDGTLVASTLTVSGGRDSIVLQPEVLLEPHTAYVFEITDGVRDIAGRRFQPYRIEFTTGSEAPAGPSEVAFEPETVFTGEPLASLTIGPDGMLYATSLEGGLLRWSIRPDGTLDEPERYALGDRALIGIAFDPEDPRTVWITHNAPLPYTGDAEIAEAFTGRVARVDLGGGPLEEATHEDVVVGLPRSSIDHMTNSLAFGPDGALYLTQGGNTSNGRTDPAWGRRPERLLSAAVLRIDTDAALAVAPLDVTTGASDGATGDYDPGAPSAPVTIFATGLRNAYDLVWHADGDLYVPVNGGNGGNTPGSPDGSVPALTGVDTQPDFLHRIAPGGYYGHPNPARGEYVLNGGNPTAGDDGVDEVAPGSRDGDAFAGYPVGTLPEPHYGGYVTAFEDNASANGVIQYASSAFGGALRDRLLVAIYTMGRIEAIDVTSGDAHPPRSEVVTGLEHPVDLVEDVGSGDLYVAENHWGSDGEIVLLRVAD